MAEIQPGLREARACARSGLWTAQRPHGAGWGRSPPPVILSKAFGFAVPRSAPRSQSYGGERGSGVSSAAFRTSPASHQACVWGSFVKADLKMVGVLRYCWIVVFDSYVCGQKEINETGILDEIT